MPDRDKISRYAKTTAKSGKGGELSGILLEAAEENRAIEGCLQYEVHQSVFDPDTIWVTESWVDQDAVKASLENEANKELIGRARPLIEDMELVELVPLGGIEARLDDPRPATAEPGYTHTSIDQIEDQAPGAGMEAITEAHFAGEEIGIRQTGFGYFRVKPGQRIPFGHAHEKAEEVYLVTEGSGRIKLDDEIREISKGDILRVGPEVIRAMEAGPEGLEYIAFGQKHVGDGELKPGWWTD